MKRFLIPILAVSMLLPCFAGCVTVLDVLNKDEPAAMRTENYTITDKMYAYIFYNIYNNYYSYFGDSITSLLGYIQNNARTQAQQILALCEGANNEGVTLSAEEVETIDKNLRELVDNLREQGTNISEYFGNIGVTSDDVRHVMVLTAIASKYQEKKTEDLTASVENDEATLLEYANENSIEMDMSETKNVGHILIKVDAEWITSGTTDEERERIEAENEKKYAEALPAAEGYLDEFLATDRTKEDFEMIGEKYTDDSNVFYENVRDGDMVDAFNDWIFDPARRVGDTSIVKTEYGWHVMYFAGDGRLVWVDDAITSWVSDQWTAWFDDAYEGITVNENIIGTIDGSKSK
ncbi:MAG: peptidylprolyl isomerase [Clostridia bacterium]|nr:peptidylprolyl isomerase [Clostridia bacterium]